MEPLCETFIWDLYLEPLYIWNLLENLYVEPLGTWCQVSGQLPQTFIGRDPKLFKLLENNNNHLEGGEENIYESYTVCLHR